MYLKVVLDENAKMPTKAHEPDAGFDIYNREGEVLIPPNGSAIFDTGVHIEIPNGMVGFLKSRSGLNVKHGISSEGVIDAGYTGSIIVKLYNHSDKEYKVEMGDKITQLVLLPIPTITLRKSDSLSKSERGEGGIGSTGK